MALDLSNVAASDLIKALLNNPEAAAIINKEQTRLAANSVIKPTTQCMINKTEGYLVPATAMNWNNPKLVPFNSRLQRPITIQQGLAWLNGGDAAAMEVGAVMQDTAPAVAKQASATPAAVGSQEWLANATADQLRVYVAGLSGPAPVAAPAPAVVVAPEPAPAPAPVAATPPPPPPPPPPAAPAEGSPAWIADATKEQLQTYASQQFGIDFEPRMTLQNMRSQLTHLVQA